MNFGYLVELKKEFNTFMNNILIIHIYNGLTGMLDYSINMYNLIEEKQKKDKNLNNPGIINIFKMCLADITTLNSHEIEKEYINIKNKSGCSDWFDNLIKACFKSYVMLLTWNPETSTSKYSENELYDKISIKDFIHNCYIETGNYFNANPEFFLKKNMKKEIFEIIEKCIDIAIKKSLPYNDIIQEYLKINFNNITNNYDNENKNSIEIDNIKKLVNELINKTTIIVPNIVNHQKQLSNTSTYSSSETSSSYQNIEENDIINKQHVNQFFDEEIENELKKKEYEQVIKSINETILESLHNQINESDNNSKIISDNNSKIISDNNSKNRSDNNSKNRSDNNSKNKSDNNSKNKSDNNSKEEVLSEQHKISDNLVHNSITDILNNISKTGNSDKSSKTSESSESSKTSKTSKTSEIDELSEMNEINEMSESIKFENIDKFENIENLEFEKTDNFVNNDEELTTLVQTRSEIKRNEIDRILDILPSKNDINKKKKIEVNINRKNTLSEQIDTMEPFFNSLIK
jgi:hypothetical protein